MVVYRLLGPLEVVSDGETLSLGGSKPRELLALLILSADQTLSRDRIVDVLWDEPPASAHKIVQNGVVRLRRLLPAGALITRGHGYELRLGAAQTDLAQFGRLVEAADAATRSGDYSAAARLLRDGLALWRGPALADVRTSRELCNEGERLDGLRRSALGDRIDADLALGRHESVIRELRRLVADDPLSERPRAQLMLALYRCGRQGEALSVYRSTRAELIDQLGVEPGVALRRLEQAILRQDPALDPPTTNTFRPTSFLRPRRVAAVVAVLAATAVGSSLVLLHGSSGASVGTAKPPNDVAVIDQSGRVTARIEVGIQPTSLAYDGRTVWVVDLGSGTLTPIEARGPYRPQAAVAMGLPTVAALTAVAVASKTVWVADSASGTLTPVPPPDGPVGIPISLGTAPHIDYLTLASGRGRLWVVSSKLSSLLAFDTAKERVIARTPIPGRAIAAAVGAGRVWCISAAGRASGYLFAIDPHSQRITERIPLAAVPTAVSVAFGAIWVAVGNRIVEIAPQNGAVRRTIKIGGSATALTPFARSLWVADGRDQTLERIDITTGDVAETVKLAGSPHALLAAANRLWALGG